MKLEKEAGVTPKQYRNLTIWQPNKIIAKLKKKTSQHKFL